ncbi:MAG TPA: monovalent cation/H(+) antiporter subunit G [Candidatus Competibacteraceae bacterium]|nr:monovalent cation/H(+) antiporter subunit G [Candidatus Competibacteraceae bacterium]
MLAWLLDALSWSLLLSGAFFIVVGAVGVLRMPDFYTRMHAASITDTLGTGLLMLGLLLQGGLTLVTVKLLLILIFLLATSPTAAHALARAALSDGLRPLLHEKKEAPPSKS